MRLFRNQRSWWQCCCQLWCLFALALAGKVRLEAELNCSTANWIDGYKGAWREPLFRVSFITVFSALLLMFSVPARAADIAFDIGSGSININTTDRTYNGTAYSSEDTFIISGSSTTNTITVTGSGSVDITLVNLTISISTTAFSIASGATVNLTVLGVNKLSSGAGAGLQVPAGTTLTISGTANDSMTAIGGSGAGIGGGYGGGGGSITINGGTITASGGDNGAGIGGGFLGAGGAITINSGMVNATGGSNSAGIGGGYGGGGGSITIRGGTVVAAASSGNGNAGIGLGYGATGGSINISGGMVTAYGYGGSGIGIGKVVSPTVAAITINISGGTVTATGSYLAAGIGSGSGNINISGGTVTAYGVSSSFGSAGIGCLNAGGAITISGTANVMAFGGNSSNPGIGGGAGIGSCGSSSGTGRITIDNSAGTVTVNATGGTSTSTGGQGATIGQGDYSGGNGAGIDNFLNVPNAATVPVGGNVTLAVTAPNLQGANAPTLSYAWIINRSSATPIGAGTTSTPSTTYGPISAAMTGYSVTITATGGSLAGTDSITYISPTAALTVQGSQAPTITTTNPLLAGTVGAPYSTTLAASPAATSWTISSGALPNGLSLNAGAGVISGTPTAAGTFNFSVIASNAGGPSTAQPLSITVVAVTNPAATTYTRVTAGYYHTCGLVSDGTVQCWGYNGSGQLGNGANTNSNVPVPVSGLTGVKAIRSGYQHTCALLNDGTVKCWGLNTWGQLGDGVTTNSNIPVTVPGLTGVTAIDTGDAYSCALLGDGTVQCWGDNSSGQLGDGSTTNHLTPITVASLADIAAIDTGYYHTCVVLDDGTAKCLGSDSYGQLGDGNTTASRTPVAVPGFTDLAAISAGYYHTCVLLADSTVQCWGLNNAGQLGDGSTVNRKTPAPVLNLTGVAALSGGYSYTCALLGDGTAKCWGANSYGQLGNGSTTNRSSPVAVSGLTGAVDINAWTNQTCAVTSDGSILCWGWNNYGELGNGTNTNSSVPVQVTHSGSNRFYVGSTGITAGLGTANIDDCGFNVDASGFVDPSTLSALPAGVTLPYGAFQLTATGCTSGGQVHVTLTLPSSLAGAALWMYNGSTWAQYTPDTISGNTITYTVTDNGTGDLNATSGAITFIAGPSNAPTAGAPIISTSSLPGAKVGVPYSATLSASPAAASWANSGALPTELSWITLNNSGAISGTPTTAGTFGFSVMAANANGTSAPITLSITVAAAGPPAAPVITAPVSGASVGSGLISVTGTAEPGASVQIYVDGNSSGASVLATTAGAFAAQITLSTGTHSLTAQASSARGASPSSNAVSVTYAISAPTVSFLTPAGNAVLSASTTVQVNATDTLGITQVQFYADGVLIGSRTSAPWSVTWSIAGVADGAHTLQAVATNNAGITGQASRSVQVQQPPATPVVPPPPYVTRNVSASPSLSYGQSTIQIQGDVVDGIGQPVPNAALLMALRVQSFQRNFSLLGDASGHFSYTFTPQSSDMGTYSVNVVYPNSGVSSADAPQSSFTINRLSVNYGQYTLNAIRGFASTVPLTVTTSAGTGATGVHWEALAANQPSGSLPPGITLGLGAPVDIRAGTSAPVNVTLTGNASASETGTIILTLFANESGRDPRAQLQLNYRLYDAQPGLSPSPTLLQLGVQQNHSVSGVITVTNKGYAPAQSITVALQAQGGGAAPAWMHLDSVPTIGALDIGESTTIQVTARPDATVADGYYQMQLKVSAGNDPGGTVPITIAVAQDGQGGIAFQLVDIYTGTLDANGKTIQGVSGATVQLQNQALTGTIYKATSDGNGQVLFTNIPPGNYTWRISATNHVTASGTSTIYANLSTSQRVFMDYQLVSITFSVTETTIRDTYNVTLAATYETQVPAPVVMIEPLSVNLPAMQPCEQYNGQFTITNYGLVRADDVKFSLPPNDASYSYQFFGQLPTSLEAKTRIIIPYTVTAACP